MTSVYMTADAPPMLDEDVTKMQWMMRMLQNAVNDAGSVPGVEAADAYLGICSGCFGFVLFEMFGCATQG
jgi:hypothetical protein